MSRYSKCIVLFLVFIFISTSLIGQRGRKVKKVDKDQWVSVGAGFLYHKEPISTYFGLGAYDLQFTKNVDGHFHTTGLRIEKYLADRFKDPIEQSVEKTNNSFAVEGYYARSLFKSKSDNGFRLNWVVSIGYYKDMYTSNIATVGSNRNRERYLTLRAGIKPSYNFNISDSYSLFLSTQVTIYEIGVLECNNFNPAFGGGLRDRVVREFYHGFFRKRIPFVIGVRKKI